MHKLLSKHFRKPSGLLGLWVGKNLLKQNCDVYKELERLATFEKGMRVFEIGYGPGLGATKFALRYNLQYEGIDFSHLMYKKASKRVRKAKLTEQAKLRYGNFLTESFQNEHYDRILFANVTYFWKELKHPFHKMFEMLKPKSRLVFYMSDVQRLQASPLANTPHFHHHSRADIEEALSQSGFQNIRFTDILEDNPGRCIVEAEKF
jgi:cyclopropane fatty-acyl-phospholipid synthase-like methyltransferase